MADMTCPDCNVTLVRVERKVRVSGAGIISVVLFLAGLIALAFNVIIGVVIWILAALVGMGGEKCTVMVCPSCKRDITSLS